MGCTKDVCLVMLGEPVAKKVVQVPLSNDTIAQCINDLALDTENQLKEQIKLANYFSLQFDELTDVANSAILMVYVQFQYKDNSKEEYFFSASLPTNTTSSEVFKALNDYILGKCGLDFKFCVGICSDGTVATTGQYSGAVTQIKALAPESKSTHFFIHRESLVTQKMLTEPDNVLGKVVKILNHVKVNALNARLFAASCDGMGVVHKRHLLRASVHWLLRGKVLSRVFELQKAAHPVSPGQKPDWSVISKCGLDGQFGFLGQNLCSLE